MSRARIHWAPMALVGVLCLANPIHGRASSAGGSKMQDSEQIQIVSGEHVATVLKSELPVIGEALERAIKDPKLLARSGAPQPLLARLQNSVGEASYSEDEATVRAGNWILVADADGLFWQNRLSPPSPPQIGLMFVARLVASKEGWSVPAIVFQRIR